MSTLLAYVVARIILLAVAVVFNLPLLLLLLALRRRLPRQVCGALVGLGFAVAVAYIMWRIEWFDVWRHGFPSVGYLVSAYVPHMSVCGVIGYAIGYAIGRKGPGPISQPRTAS
jgi:hypothetical protein